MKFELRASDDTGAEIIHKFEEVYLPDVLQRLTEFLKGAGFVILNESLELAPWGGHDV